MYERESAGMFIWPHNKKLLHTFTLCMAKARKGEGKGEGGGAWIERESALFIVDLNIKLSIFYLTFVGMSELNVCACE